MNSNTFGSLFQFHAFGESHGPSMGVIVEGCPAGVDFSMELLNKELDRRRPGKWPWVSPRKEKDAPEILSGVYKNKTLGTPIAIIIRNTNAQSKDYKDIERNPRSGHADDLWRENFKHNDPRGGGRASGRETISRVVAGAVARMFIKQVHPDFKIMAFVRQVESIYIEDSELKEAESLFRDGLSPDTFPASFPEKIKSERVKEMLMKTKGEGGSVGSLVEVWLENLPK